MQFQCLKQMFDRRRVQIGAEGHQAIAAAQGRSRMCELTFVVKPA